MFETQEEIKKSRHEDGMKGIECIELRKFITEYKQKNEKNEFKPVAVGKYGIRTRESIYSKELAKDYSKNKIIFKNTLTVGMGSRQIDIGILTDDVIYSVSPAYHTYKISGINADYLRYCLMCRNEDMFKRFVKRGSRQGKSIDLKRWLEYEIPVYDVCNQEKIVLKLDKVTNVISMRKQQLQKLDELIQARFVEMFEKKNCESVRLGDVCTKITDGTHKTPDYLDKGITFISAKNIVNGELDFSDVKHISEEQYMEIQKRCQTELNDILLSKSGSLGVPVIIKTDKRLGLFESLAVIKYDRTKLIPEFLCEQLKTERIQRQFRTGIKGVAVKHLHLGVISDIRVIVPPIEEQNQFADFVNQVNKSKLVIKTCYKYISIKYRCENKKLETVSNRSCTCMGVVGLGK